MDMDIAKDKWRSQLRAVRKDGVVRVYLGEQVWMIGRQEAEDKVRDMAIEFAESVFSTDLPEDGFLHGGDGVKRSVRSMRQELREMAGVEKCTP